MNQLVQSPGVDLVREPDFSLGGLSVSPSTGRVRARGRDQRVEPRVMEVLVVLARAAGRTVSRDELIEACWGGRFVSDDAVARVIAKVRSLARGVEPEPFVLETLPKVGFRLVAAGQAPAGTAAPDEAEKSPSAPGRAPPLAAAVARRWRLLAALALALTAVVVGAVWLAWRADRPLGPDGRVEVMLFEPLQPEPALQRYATALGDAVVRGLASNGVKTLQRPAPRDAGGKAGDAEFRVAGTVDRDGDRYVVNAQILDQRTGMVLWSGRFDRDAAAPVGFHEEAAHLIGDNLHCALWYRAADGKPMEPAVFSLFLNACALRPRRTTSDPRPYAAAAARVAQAAPDLSHAHSLHALALAIVAGVGTSDPVQAERAGRAAEAAAGRALRLDPRNGQAHAALAARYNGWGHWLEREKSVLRALELSPDLLHGQNFYTGMLLEVGRREDAMEVNRRAISLDPFSPYLLGTLGQSNAIAGNHAEAEAHLKRVELIDPDRGRQHRYQIALWWENPREGLPKLRRYADPADRRRLACHEAYLARLIQADGAPQRGLPEQCVAEPWDYRARMLARAGDIDGAYAAFAAAGPGTVRFPIYLFYPEMKGFRADRRFMPLAHRLGLVEYWTKSGAWPDFCAEPDLPYDCKAEAARLVG
jgi:DNA-binding winged helix-turn-helix (wHTH) protein/TolB-like protein